MPFLFVFLHFSRHIKFPVETIDPDVTLRDEDDAEESPTAVTSTTASHSEPCI